jgi:hypothetical protein
MRAIVILTAMLIGVTPAAGQERDRAGGLGGVLDTLTGLLGGISKVPGTVVLARDTTIVFRTDDGRTLRVDTASLAPDLRTRLQPGQGATLTARGAGSDIVTATEVQLDQAGTGRTFQRVEGTVQERTQDRVLFRTRDGLTLPVDTSRIRGLPAFQPSDPAPLIYEQGPRQELVAVWLEPAGAVGAPVGSAVRPGDRVSVTGTVGAGQGFVASALSRAP